MARLQILELPEGAGDDRPPFILVIDQADYDSLSSLSAALEGWQNVKDQIGARAVLVFEDAIDIPANDTTAYAVGGLLPANCEGPDFTSPLAGKIEVRKPCPYCGDRQMIPTHQFREHVARLHPDESAADA